MIHGGGQLVPCSGCEMERRLATSSSGRGRVVVGVSCGVTLPCRWLALPEPRLQLLDSLLAADPQPLQELLIGTRVVRDGRQRLPVIVPTLRTPASVGMPFRSPRTGTVWFRTIRATKSPERHVTLGAASPMSLHCLLVPVLLQQRLEPKVVVGRVPGGACPRVSLPRQSEAQWESGQSYSRQHVEGLLTSSPYPRVSLTGGCDAGDRFPLEDVTTVSYTVGRATRKPRAPRDARGW
jgi:hypothetical protein